MIKRSLLALVALIGLALAATLLASTDPATRVAADAGHTGLDFSMGIDVDGDTTDDCNTSGGPTKCTIGLGDVFTLKTYLNSTGGKTYIYLANYVQYGGVSSESNATVTWPGCSSPSNSSFSGVEAWDCLGSASTYTGQIGTADFRCTGAGFLTMVHGIGNFPAYTTVVEPGFVEHAETQDSTETLTINCPNQDQEINITITDELKGTPLPNTCWVFSSGFGTIATVGDNGACPGTFIDADPAPGSIQITVEVWMQATFGKQWDVQQTDAPDGFNVDPTLYPCDFTLGKCTVNATNAFKGEPSVHGSWNLTFSPDFGSCTGTFTQTKGTSGNDPLSASIGCIFLSFTGSVGGGAISITGADVFGGCAINADVSWNGNELSGTYSCIPFPGDPFSGTVTGVRKPTPGEINIDVTDTLKDTPLPNTCWSVYYAAFGKNNLVDIVSDNDAKPVACDDVETPLVDLSDGDPAVGSIEIAISGAMRSAYGDEWHVEQYQAPAGYTMDPTKHVCVLSLGKCDLAITNDPPPYGDGELNITVEDGKSGDPIGPGTCWQVFVLYDSGSGPANNLVDYVSDNNSKSSCDSQGPVKSDLSDSDPAAGSLAISISASLRATYGDDWRIQQVQTLAGYLIDPAKQSCIMSDPPDIDKCDFAVVNDVDPDGDIDGDGCPNGDEQQTAFGSEMSGGRRNYLNPHDYFNPTDDGENRIDDVLAVLNQYYDDDTDGNPGLPPYTPGYDPDTDRTDDTGSSEVWDLGPPNGQQRIDDVLAIIYQYFHDCM
jgi:hypothetical protein